MRPARARPGRITKMRSGLLPAAVAPISQSGSGVGNTSHTSHTVPRSTLAPGLCPGAFLCQGDRMEYSDTLLRDVFERVKTIACVGASMNPLRASHYVSCYLTSKGYTVYPINPGHIG